MIIRSLVGTIINILFVASMVFAWHGELVQAGVLLIALSVVNVFYNGLPFTIFWSLSGLGLILLGYEKNAFAMGLLAIALMILAADIMLWIRAIKRSGKLGLFRLKITPDKSKIYARMDFYKENEITSILWNKLTKNQIQPELKTNSAEDISNTASPIPKHQRKKIITFFLAELVLIMLLSSGIVICLLYEKLVWLGIVFIIVGIVNIFFLPVTNFFILLGLAMVSLGFQEKGLAIIFGAFGLVIITTNVILMHKSILSGRLERLGILAKSNRFAFFDYLRENEITCILLNKLKRSLKRK